MTGCSGGPAFGRFFGGFCWVLASVLGVAMQAAPAADSVAVAVEVDVPSNVGDVAEVGVSVNYGSPAPTVMFIFLAFENTRLAPAEDYYETTPVDARGNPLRDEEGNVQAVLSPVWPYPAVASAGKTVDVEVYDALDDNAGRGGIGIALTGLNSDPLPEGTVLKVAFRVLNNNRSDDVVPVYGIDDAHPAVVGGHIISSSASTVSGDNISVTVSDGSVALGCERPAAPTGVTASQDKTGNVTVSWTGVGGMEYRVFRSETDDVWSAQALGDTWTTENSFEDVTAAVPVEISSPGCFKPGEYDAVPYYYWVKCRDGEGGCESDASTPSVQGWRAASKAVVAAGWPPREPGAWLVFAVMLCFFAVRPRRPRRSE